MTLVSGVAVGTGVAVGAGVTVGSGVFIGAGVSAGAGVAVGGVPVPPQAVRSTTESIATTKRTLTILLLKQ